MHFQEKYLKTRNQYMAALSLNNVRVVSGTLLQEKQYQHSVVGDFLAPISTRGGIELLGLVSGLCGTAPRCLMKILSMFALRSKPVK